MIWVSCPDLSTKQNPYQIWVSRPDLSTKQNPRRIWVSGRTNHPHAGVRGYPARSLAGNPRTPAWVWWKPKTPDPDHELPARRPLPGSLPSCRSSICPNLPSSAIHLSQPSIVGRPWPTVHGLREWKPWTGKSACGIQPSTWI
jgi:hypothetical protein